MEDEQVVEKRENNIPTTWCHFRDVSQKCSHTHADNYGKNLQCCHSNVCAGALILAASTGNVLATIVNVGSGEKHYLICSHHAQRCRTCSREYEAEKAKQVKQEVQL